MAFKVRQAEGRADRRLADGDLAWYRNCFERDLADENKARFPRQDPRPDRCHRGGDRLPREGERPDHGERQQGHPHRQPRRHAGAEYLPSGQAVCELNVACNEVWNDRQGQKQERTEVLN